MMRFLWIKIKPRAVVPAAAVLVLALLLAAWPLPVRAQGLQEVLDAVKTRYKGLADLTADYSRTTKSPAMDSLFKAGSSHTASGRLWFKTPGLLRMEQAKPRLETLVTNGVTVWWYVPEEQEVQKYAGAELFAELKPLIDFLGGLDRLSESFVVSLSAPKEGGASSEYVLDLAPKTQGVGPQRITVRFSAKDLTLLGFRFVSVMGETTDFVLSGVKTDQKVPAGRFIFHPPTGTKVVENPEQ